MTLELPSGNGRPPRPSLAGRLFGGAGKAAGWAARTGYDIAKQVPGVDLAERGLQQVERAAVGELRKRMADAEENTPRALSYAQPPVPGGAPVITSHGDFEPLRAAMARLLEGALTQSAAERPGRSCTRPCWPRSARTRRVSSPRSPMGRRTHCSTSPSGSRAGAAARLRCLLVPEYGLSAGVWSEDVDTALDVAKRLESGTVWINDWHMVNHAYPFGGYKQSGIGRELGPRALDEYTEEKFIHIDLARTIENKIYDVVVPRD